MAKTDASVLQTGETGTRKYVFARLIHNDSQRSGGTIFLDEIGEMDISLQTRLLRVLETGQFMKIGSTYSNTCRCPSYSSNKSRFGTRNS